ncbi:MAG: TetR family transcriptional regulator [Colwellia sp.]|nr:MAG: TetR family transcriptional regulator [Colwellia sp.]
MTGTKQARHKAIGDMKRNLILDAAKTVFKRDGLAGGSLRAIAKEAGYTTAALYSYFDSKESIYANLLRISLENLKEHIDASLLGESNLQMRIYKNAKSFYQFYANNPQDLELGFYLFKGGIQPEGVGVERNKELNNALLLTLQPIITSCVSLGKKIIEAKAIAAEILALISGVLLLHFTHRIKIFDVNPEELFETHIQRVLDTL